MRKNKFNAVKVEYYGILFDSKKERDYYIKLVQLEKEEKIFFLQRQVKFQLQPSYINYNGKKIREVNYIADFVYYDENKKMHVIDTKGFRTDIYKLKKKLFEYKFPDLVIEEV